MGRHSKPVIISRLICGTDVNRELTDGVPMYLDVYRPIGWVRALSHPVETGSKRVKSLALPTGLVSPAKEEMFNYFDFGKYL